MLQYCHVLWRLELVELASSPYIMTQNLVQMRMIPYIRKAQF